MAGEETLYHLTMEHKYFWYYIYKKMSGNFADLDNLWVFGGELGAIVRY